MCSGRGRSGRQRPRFQRFATGSSQLAEAAGSCLRLLMSSLRNASWRCVSWGWSAGDGSSGLARRSTAVTWEEPGNRNDVTQLLPLVDRSVPVRPKVGRPRQRAERLLADRGADHGKYRRELWKRGVKRVIARPGTAHGSGLGRERWVRRANLRAPAQPPAAADPLRTIRPTPPSVHAARLRRRLPTPPSRALTLTARGQAQPADRRPY
jgi:hypothetical protein